MQGTPMAARRRLSVFVDGENFSLRLKDIEGAVAPRYTRPAGYAEPDAAFWAERYSNSTFGLPEERTELVRVAYYTSANGDEGRRLTIRRELQRLGIGHTFVAPRGKGRQSKTVDIQLATDLLVTASERQVDDIVLVAADADYLPVVTTAKRFGVRVFLAFPGLQALGDIRVENQDAVRRALGLALDAEYPLAFDGIRAEFEWLDYQKLTIEELSDLARTTMWGAAGRGQGMRAPDALSGTAATYIIGNGKLSLDSNGHVRRVVEGRRDPPGEILIWPTATFRDRYRKWTRQDR